MATRATAVPLDLPWVPVEADRHDAPAPAASYYPFDSAGAYVLSRLLGEVLDAGEACMREYEDLPLESETSFADVLAGTGGVFERRLELLSAAVDGRSVAAVLHALLDWSRNALRSARSNVGAALAAKSSIKVSVRDAEAAAGQRLAVGCDYLTWLVAMALFSRTWRPLSEADLLSHRESGGASTSGQAEASGRGRGGAGGGLQARRRVPANSPTTTLPDHSKGLDDQATTDFLTRSPDDVRVLALRPELGLDALDEKDDRGFGDLEARHVTVLLEQVCRKGRGKGARREGGGALLCLGSRVCVATGSRPLCGRKGGVAFRDLAR